MRALRGFTVLILNPAMTSEYLITVCSFLYALVDKVERSVLCYSAVSIQTGTYYFVLFYSSPEEHLLAHGNIVLFLCLDLKSNLNNGYIHLYVRPTVAHVSAETEHFHMFTYNN